MPIFTSLVAVLMPSSIEDVVNVYKELQPSAIQLHGYEDIEFIKNLKKIVNIPIIKALHIPKDDNLDINEIIKIAKSYSKYVDAILVDTKIENIKIEGKTHNWEVSKKIRENIDKPLILAGGLNKNNVVDAIKKVQPYGIDVSSSLESEKGKKDYKKVDEFLGVVYKYLYQ